MGEDRPTAEMMLEMGAGDDEDFDGEGGDDDGGGKKRLLIIIALPLLLIIGGGAGAYFSGLADPLLDMLGGAEPEVTEGDTEGDPAEPSGPAPVGSAVFYDLPEMLVNLNTPGSKRNFLKMTISLELKSENDITAIESVLPRIIDNFQVYLRELRLEDLQGAQGMFRLRNELRDRVNEAVAPSEIDDVLFREIIVQ
jgi:flagellar FliL protein